MSTHRAYITTGFLFIFLVASVWAISFFQKTVAPTLPVEISTVAVPPSPEIVAYLAQSKGFQYLISYTDRGFEPQSLEIKGGETVRFINNSKEKLWVSSASDVGALYPGTGSECGQSSFDSCKEIKSGEFWEFEFAIAGTWSFRNAANPERQGIVVVSE